MQWQRAAILQCDGQLGQRRALPVRLQRQRWRRDVYRELRANVEAMQRHRAAVVQCGG